MLLLLYYLGEDGDSVLTEKSKREWEAWIEEKKEKERKIEKKIIVKNGEIKDDAIEKKISRESNEVEKKVVDDSPHDTVGLICMDSQGRLACGTSTSGYVQLPSRVYCFN